MTDVNERETYDKNIIQLYVIFSTFPCFTLLHYTHILPNGFHFYAGSGKLLYLHYIYLWYFPPSKITPIVWYLNFWLNNGKLIYPHLSTDKGIVTSLIYSWTNWNCLCVWWKASWKCGSRDVFLCYLGNSRAAVTTHCLNSFGIKHRLLLVKAFIHVAYIAFLCLQHAGQIDLGKIHILRLFTEWLFIQNNKK